MKLPDLATYGDHETLRQTIEAVASDGKVTGGVIAANGAILGAVNAEVITGYVSLYSTVIGAVTLTVVCGVWIVKFIRDWNSLQRERKE